MFSMQNIARQVMSESASNYTWNERYNYKEMTTLNTKESKKNYRHTTSYRIMYKWQIIKYESMRKCVHMAKDRTEGSPCACRRLLEWCEAHFYKNMTKNYWCVRTKQAFSTIIICITMPRSSKMRPRSLNKPVKARTWGWTSTQGPSVSDWGSHEFVMSSAWKSFTIG